MFQIIVPYEIQICITARRHTTYQRQHVLFLSSRFLFSQIDSMCIVHMAMATLLAIKTVYCVSCQCKKIARRKQAYCTQTHYAHTHIHIIHINAQKMHVQAR